MILGKNSRLPQTVNIHQWDQINDPVGTFTSSFSSANFTDVNDFPHSPLPYLDSVDSLYHYRPSNEFANDSESTSGDESHADSFACDEFRMYEFKVLRCSRDRSHDWTECPFAHPGEKARRRDPRKYHYSGTACPEFRKGSCRRGDSCEFAHGVFECWLHPSRYRTQPCNDGTSCRRRNCFFAHTPEQLRVLPCSVESDFGLTSIRNRFKSHLSKSVTVSSPTSILTSPPVSPPSESPPLSPSTSDLIATMRKLQLRRGSWNSPTRSGLGLNFSSSLRPIQGRTWPRLRNLENWNNAHEEIPVMELVESGKELRASMYAKLSKENSLG